MTNYTKLVEELRSRDNEYRYKRLTLDAAAAIEALQAEVERLRDKLCGWCAVCPKERRNPDDCELLGENPVMYGPSGAKMEVQDGK